MFHQFALYKVYSYFFYNLYVSRKVIEERRFKLKEYFASPSDAKSYVLISNTNLLIIILQYSSSKMK